MDGNASGYLATAPRASSLGALFVAKMFGVSDGARPNVARSFLVAFGLAAWVFVVWAVFRYVVTDEAELLDYLRVLIWPLVILGVVSVFRRTIEDKFRQLLKLSAFGGSAQFAADALERDLGPDIARLLNPPPDGHEASDNGRTPDDVPDDGQPGEGPDAGTDDASTDPVSEGPGSPTDGELTSARPDAAAVNGGGERPPATEGTHDPGVGAGFEDVAELAEGIGVPPGEIRVLRRKAESDPTAAIKTLKLRALRAAKNARDVRNQAAHRQEETRDSIESVIRKSAAWGYEMGRAGAPEAVPDVEWNDDGSWRISTEIPKAKPVPKRTAATVSSEKWDYSRQVKALEDEIKALERKKHTGLGVAFLGLNEEGWLVELKRRLRRVDPGNPWAN